MDYDIGAIEFHAQRGRQIWVDLHGHDSFCGLAESLGEDAQPWADLEDILGGLQRGGFDNRRRDARVIQKGLGKAFGRSKAKGA